MTDIFLSYAHEDRDRVRPLVAALTGRGWNVWWDRDIEAGTVFDREIESAIDQARCVVVVWTERSVESDWVRSEAHEGLDRKILVPVLLDDVRPPLAFRQVQSVDLHAYADSDAGKFTALLEAATRLMEEEPGLAPGAQPDSADDAPLGMKPGRLFRVLALMVIVVLVFYVGSRWWSAPVPDGSKIETREPPGDRRPSTVEKNSIAVLPFVNNSADQENEYFSDGLTETLLHMLAQLPELKVAARTSSFAFKGRGSDIRDVALVLGVAHVLEGSVQKSRDRVRVTAQLIRAEDGFQVWSQKYDRRLDDIFAIQDEIATEVSTALSLALSPRDTVDLGSVGTRDVTAYELYLEARYQQSIYSEESLNKAEALLKSALAKDPEFREARIALAGNLLRQADTHMSQLAVYLEEATAYLAPVLSEAPDNVAARGLALLITLMRLNHLEDADRASMEAIVNELQVLLSESQGDPYVRNYTAYYLMSLDRDEESLQVAQQGLVSDPLNPELLWAEAIAYNGLRRPEAARRSLLKALELTPDNPWLYSELARSARLEGDYPGQLRYLRKAMEVDPGLGDIRNDIARIFYYFGLLEAADYWLDSSRMPLPEFDVDALSLIAAGAARADNEAVLSVAREEIEDREDYWSAYYDHFVSPFARTMHAAGKSREALEYLSIHVPQLNDFVNLPGQSRDVIAQMYSFALRSDVMAPDEFRRLLNDYVSRLDSHIVPGRDDVLLIEWNVLAGKVAQAKADFLEGSRDELQFHQYWLTGIGDSPWLVDLRRDPEVASRLSELERRKEEDRLKVQELLQTPGWRIR